MNCLWKKCLAIFSLGPWKYEKTGYAILYVGSEAIWLTSLILRKYLNMSLSPVSIIPAHCAQSCFIWIFRQMWKSMASMKNVAACQCRHWETVYNLVNRAVIFIDAISAELLHWQGGLLKLLSAGATDVKEFSSFEVSLSGCTLYKHSKGSFCVYKL